MPGLLAIIAAILLMGQALAGPAEPVRLMDPDHPTDSLIGLAEPDPLLAAMLPNYGQDAPEGCLEDMFCWMGSTSDGRSDEELRADLPEDVFAYAAAYPEDDLWVPADPGWSTEPNGTEHGPCLANIGDTTFVVCSDGYIFTS